MTNLSSKLISALSGRTISTAESCTGGGIGAALTAIPGSSAVYLGGIISYTNGVKIRQLGVSEEILNREGAVSAAVAEAMASGVRMQLETDVALSVTGLAGPGGDDFGNPVGTVYIGYSDRCRTLSRKYNFTGDRDDVRKQAVDAALQLALSLLKDYGV